MFPVKDDAEAYSVIDIRIEETPRQDCKDNGCRQGENWFNIIL